MSKKSNISIWKIDEDHRIFAEADNNNEKIKKIIRLNNKEEVEKADRESRSPNRLEKVSDEINPDGFSVLIYKKYRTSFGLSLLLSNYLERSFINSSNDLICFFYTDDIIFVITSGAGFHIISPYADDDFPFHVAKKIFSGNFSQQEVRKITGVTYSEMLQYRGKGHKPSRRESFGKIWKKLIGKIRSNVVSDFPSLASIIDVDKKNNAEIKSSIVFKKTLTIETLLEVLSALKNISEQELTDEEKANFSFLDTVKLVSDKLKQKQLFNSLIEKLRSIAKSENWDDAENFDFCHPSEPFSFFSGENFSIEEKLVAESNEPNTKDVLKFIKDNNILDVSNFDIFKLGMETKNFTFKDRETERTISASLLKYFHGELLFDSKTYFLIDGKWYEVHENFLENLKKDFIQEVFDENEKIYTEDIPFINWEPRGNGKYYEEDFNVNQSTVTNFYHGDKILVKVEKGEIELFDLLYETDEYLYIIQAKNGFGGSTRDACSQIQMAAETIEQDLRFEKNIIKGLYEKWAENDENNLTESEFLDLFEKKRKYILACSVPEFSKDVFENDNLFSHIAKFETLELAHYFAGNKWEFNIQNINKRNFSVS